MMKMSKWMAGMLAGALGLGAMAATAQDKPAGNADRAERRGMMFAALDTNGDGQVTLEEMTARHAARFESADADGDGLLSAEEMNAAAAARIAERTDRVIARMDENGDGLLSPEEMQGRRDPAAMIKRMDRNGDGAIGEEEFSEARGMMRDHHGTGRHHGGDAQR